MELSTFLHKSINLTANAWNNIKISLYTIFAFLNIDIEIVEILFYLIIIDMVCGIIKSIVVKKLIFNFKDLYLGLLTKFVIILIPMLVSLTALGLGIEFIWVTELALRLLVLSESISILSNIISIKQRKEVANRDYLSLILNYFRNLFISLIDKILNNNKPL
jgi:phage-related holin